jgi:hypothetical protein
VTAPPHSRDACTLMHMQEPILLVVVVWMRYTAVLYQRFAHSLITVFQLMSGDAKKTGPQPSHSCHVTRWN